MFNLFSGVVVQVFVLKIVGAGKLRLSGINFSSELGIFHHLAVSFSVLLLRTIDVVEDLLGSDLHQLQELLLGQGDSLLVSFHILLHKRVQSIRRQLFLRGSVLILTVLGDQLF